ncbi:hypothetical protein ACFOEK_10785 [Litoribrevibacter euphylliae]|uniref:Helix-turn-helix DNA binding domain protein n=1 Tax=Litoribrevibacter euphylliae TaxID=1834034 RepID=A0ABV7HJK2_9GAMM
MSTFQQVQSNHALIISTAQGAGLTAEEYMAEQAASNFPMLDPLAQEIAIEWSHNPVKSQVAKKFGITTTTLSRILGLSSVAAAVRHYRSEITEDVILDKKAIRAERMDLYAMAKGEKESHVVDRNGISDEVKETNLPVARQLLNDIEKAEQHLIDDNNRPQINIVSTGTVNIGNSGDGNFLDRFKPRSDQDASGLVDAEFEEVINE